MVGRVSEMLETPLSVSQALEGGQVAGLYVDTDDVPRVVVHRIPCSTQAFWMSSRRLAGVGI